MAQVGRAERILDVHRARGPADQLAQLGQFARVEVGLLDQDPQAGALVAVGRDESAAPDDLVPPASGGRDPKGGGVTGLTPRRLGASARVMDVGRSAEVDLVVITPTVVRS
ncbi:hypothetical protein AB0F25_12965 [Streptomyces wedmorensis]|uniref:hypothetical protein n=1 Tax=Streptomyces wedmorensis TaxID=43759 RepID=UPI003420C7B7